MRLDIKVSKKTKLVVVGDIHEHEEQFDKLLAEINPSSECILVSVGDIYDKGFGKPVAESIIDKLRVMVERGHAYVIKGNHELSSVLLAKRNKAMTSQLSWVDKLPLALTFSFSNHHKVTVVHGGVLPRHSLDDLATTVDTCYVRYVDKNGNYVKRLKQETRDELDRPMRIMVNEKPGTLWHDLYDGRHGYIASGHHAQLDGIPKFYRYSCNLDSAVYHSGKLTAQVFVDGLRDELLTFVGTPKYPDLNEMYRLMCNGRI